MSYEFYKKAIEILQRKTTIPGDGYTWEEINEAIELAIESIKLRIPTRVILKNGIQTHARFVLRIWVGIATMDIMKTHIMIDAQRVDKN